MAKKRNPNTENPKVNGNGADGVPNDDFAEKAKAIKSQWAVIDENDTLACYDLACELKEVRADSKYGDKAVSKLAEELGRSKTTIHDYANVAAKWPEKDEFEKVATQHDKFGKPLSWSHFVLLATVEHGGQRKSLFNKALANNWSYKELKTEVNKLKPNSSSGDQQSGAKIEAAANKFFKQLESTKVSSEAFHSDFVEKLSDLADEELTEELLESFTTAHTGLKEFYTAALKDLDTSISEIEKRRSSDRDNESIENKDS